MDFCLAAADKWLDRLVVRIKRKTQVHCNPAVVRENLDAGAVNQDSEPDSAVGRSHFHLLTAA